LFTSWFSCQIKVQQPISGNGNLKGVSYKEGNKWKRNAYHKCNKGGEKTVENVKKCAYNTKYFE